eukprot:50812-Pyramimonas_sp.AAC.1
MRKPRWPSTPGTSCGILAQAWTRSSGSARISTASQWTSLPSRRCDGFPSPSRGSRGLAATSCALGT